MKKLFYLFLIPYFLQMNLDNSFTLFDQNGLTLLSIPAKLKNLAIRQAYDFIGNDRTDYYIEFRTDIENQKPYKIKNGKIDKTL